MSLRPRRSLPPGTPDGQSRYASPQTPAWGLDRSGDRDPRARPGRTGQFVERVPEANKALIVVMSCHEAHDFIACRERAWRRRITSDEGIERCGRIAKRGLDNVREAEDIESAVLQGSMFT